MSTTIVRDDPSAERAADIIAPAARRQEATASVPPRATPQGVKSRRSVFLAVSIAAADVAGHERPSRELLAGARERVWALLGYDEWCTIYGDAILIRLGRGTGKEHVRRIDAIVQSLVRRPVRAGGSEHFLDVGAAWSASQRTDRARIEDLLDRAATALVARDLEHSPRRAGRVRRGHRARTAFQIALLVMVSFFLPLLGLIATHAAGIAVDSVVLVAVVSVLAVTVILLWVETILGAVRRKSPPRATEPAPLASAIIAAYLPNEQHTIVETLRAFLRQEYTGGVQVILAYNTDEPLPVEVELAALAGEYPALTLARVQDSTSKAQNVNAALALARGEFVGIFDADHHPDPGSFERAWRWIASGVDVVQGHCVVRNGDDSWVARTVAVEFEQIYAVSHPGRQRLHGYGIFGGSNGYWRTDLLRTTRMRHSMLTEDIDSSMRAIRGGAVIVNDPALISRELAPTTLRALWRQRMRWAQGWTQVAAGHGGAALASSELTVRQRLGVFFHLLWREAYPFVSALIWPLLAFYVWRDGGLSFDQPGLLLLTAVAFAFTPVAIVLTHRVADREIARRTSWWWGYLLVSVVFYQEMKNVIARLGVIKLLMGDRRWTVTSRGASSATVTDAAAESDTDDKPLVVVPAATSTE